MTESYTFWLTLAVVIGALALVVQAACLYFLYLAFKGLQARTMEFLPKAEASLLKAEATLARADKALAESRVEIAQTTAKAQAVIDLAHGQLTRVDHFVSETTGRARAQVDRVESLIDESLGRARHTVGILNDTVTGPVREVNAVSAGLRAAFGAFFNKCREPESPREPFSGRSVNDDPTVQSENHRETMSEVD